MQKYNEIWNLDKEKYHNIIERDIFLQSKGYDLNKHPKFKVGQTIEFWTGSNNNIRASATIKGLNKEEIYVYNDCYWFPIRDEPAREIKIVKQPTPN